MYLYCAAMSAPNSLRFTLVGGGLGGALLSAHLGRAGYNVDLYERRPDPAAGTLVGGRSINLAISVRGIHALSQVGLADEVLKLAVPMRGRMIHSRDGTLTFQPYDKDPSRAINSISRGGLNALTLGVAQKMPNVRVFFEHKCTEVDLDAPRAEFLDQRDNRTVQAGGDAVIGIDGAFSVVRRAMQRLDRFNYSQQYLEHGYKELSIPPKDGGGFRIEPNALHIWPRRSFMMIGLPNIDGSFTCTLFFQFDGARSFAALRSDDDVRRFFEQEFPDAVPLMPTLLQDYREHPVGSMVTVRSRPWHYGGRVALVGDAAHAVVPFYGQGANAAFEDCTVLSECLARHAPNLERAFAEYDALRRDNVNTLANLALSNFIEMRDHTGSRTFLMHKKLERTLHRALPGVYTPLYTMVSFTRTPYADAVRGAARQDRVVASIGAILVVIVLAVVFRLAGWRWSEGVLAGGVIVLAAALLFALRPRAVVD